MTFQVTVQVNTKKQQVADYFDQFGTGFKDVVVTAGNEYLAKQQAREKGYSMITACNAW